MEKRGNLNVVLALFVLIIISISLFMFSWSFVGFATYASSSSSTDFSIDDGSSTSNESNNSSLINESSNPINNLSLENGGSTESDDSLDSRVYTNISLEYANSSPQEVFGIPIYPWVYIIVTVVLIVLILIIILSLIFSMKKKENVISSSYLAKNNVLNTVPQIELNKRSIEQRNLLDNSSIPQKQEDIQLKQETKLEPKLLNLPVKATMKKVISKKNDITNINANDSQQDELLNKNVVLNDNSELTNIKPMNDNLKYIKYYSQNLSGDPKVRINYLLKEGSKFLDSDINVAKQIYYWIFEDYKRLEVHDEKLYRKIIEFNQMIGSHS